ncbi:MAG: efflux RND transporter periplasmic adaptor subunit [Spirochaetota bacterium]
MIDSTTTSTRPPLLEPKPEPERGPTREPESTRKRGARVFIALVAASLLLAGCGPGGPFGGESSEEATEAPVDASEQTAFAVNTTQSVSGEIKDYIQLNGDVQAASSVDVYPDTEGEVVTMAVREGENVSKDETIAEVDRSRPGQQFVPSPVEAPISGTLVERYVDVGATVSPSAPIATIAETGELEVRTQVAERFISFIEVGQPATIVLAAYPGVRFDARVSELSPVVDPATRTMRVMLEFVERHSRVKAGMFVEIRLVTQHKRDIVKVQSDAVVQRFETPYVFVRSDEDTVEQREVSLGIQIGEQVEITDGLDAGETVVIQGQSLLEDGASVRVIDEIEPLPANHDISDKDGS